MKKIFAIVFSMTLLFVFVSPVFGMQCRRLSFEKMLKEADVIFLGKVQRREPVINRSPENVSICWDHSIKKPHCGGKVASLSVTKVWKGKIDKDKLITVFSKDACYCVGTYFRKGDDYIVFAKKRSVKGADYESGGSCEGTESVSSETRDKVIQKLDRFFKK